MVDNWRSVRRAVMAVSEGSMRGVMQVRGRWVKVVIPGDLMSKFFTDSEWKPANEYLLKIEGVPIGAKIVDALVDRSCDHITVLLEHDSWDLTTESAAPVICPKFEMKVEGYKNEYEDGCAAERAIYGAILAVEALGADFLLTDAMLLLKQAQQSVAKWVNKRTKANQKVTPCV